MSLPLPAIDRLFDRLHATYGRQFRDLYEGLEVAAIKTAWAHELDGFTGNLHAIAWALENLPERVPNAIQFKALCRLAPRPLTSALPEPPADPKRLKAELAKLMPLVQQPVQQTDRLRWARRIVSRHENGERIAGGTLAIARAALKNKEVSHGTVT